MRIDELRKEIKILSDEKGTMLRVIERDGYVCIQRQHGLWREVALVKLDENFAINTNNIWFEMLEEEIKGRIFEILVKFARTPVDEREEEKRYQYRLKEKNMWITDSAPVPLNIEDCYLNLVLDEEKGDFIRLDNNLKCEYYVYEFTDKEIKEVAEKFDVDLEMFDKIEVTNE